MHDQCTAFCDGKYQCAQSKHKGCNCDCNRFGSYCISQQQPGNPGQRVANRVFGIGLKRLAIYGCKK